ncbi:hypothetical protein V8C42DRAFT_304488 [Trichoderma barbatum]
MHALRLFRTHRLLTMVSSNTKLMARSGWRRATLQPNATGQMVTGSHRFNQSSIHNAPPGKPSSVGPVHTPVSGEGTPYDPRAIVRVLIPISIAGWLLFGVICILCINGKGKLGRWVPEWYLDSKGTKRDKAMVVLWWVVVMLLWPMILPVLLVRKVIRLVKRRIAERKKEARMLQPRKVMEEV